MQFLVISSLNTFAINQSPENDLTSISEEIKELLKRPGFIVNEDLSAFVTLTFNKDNEIIIVSVESENEEVSNHIKTRLNYKKLSKVITNKQKYYTISIKIESKTSFN